MRLLRFLFFRRRRRAESAPIREDEAYAHSYGGRSGEVFGVVRMPEQPRAEPEPQPAPSPEPEPGLEPQPGPKPEPTRSRTGGLTGELLRRAFEAKLDARGKATT